MRRIDLVELLSDVGLGGGLRSVISQGRVETVLNSKPAERRELIEEAAGLGRFKRRRHRAELKLARVAVQVDRARDLEDEVKKRLRPLALQATAAERAEKLGVEIAGLQAAIATLDLARLAQRRAEAEGRRAATAEQRRALDEQINALVAERESAEEELTDSAGAREQATAALYRLRSGGERIALRRESAASLTSSLRAELAGGAGLRPVGVGRARGRRTRRVDGRPVGRGGARAPAGRGRRTLGPHRGDRAHAPSRPSPPSSTRCSRAAPRRSRSSPAAAATRCSRSAAQPSALGVRHESAQRLLSELQLELADARHVPAGPSPAELGRLADDADAAARAAVREQEDLEARVRLARERLVALEQSLAEREGLPPAARALAEEGEQLALQLLEVEAGAERSTAAALGHRASAVLAANPARGLELIEKAKSAGLGSVLVLVGRDPRELVNVPVLPRDELLASKVPAVTAEGIGWDPERGELWFAGETAEAVLLELDARRRELHAEVEELAARATEAGDAARAGCRAGARAAERFAPVAHLRNVRRADASRLARIVAGAERLDETLRVVAAAAGRLEAPLAERAGRLAGDLHGIASRESELRRAVSEADARALAAERRAGGRSADGRRRRARASCGSRPRISRSGRSRPARAAEEAAERARSAARALADADPGHARRPSELVLERLVGGAERLEQALAIEVEHFEAPGQPPGRGAGRAHHRARRLAAPARRRGGRAAPGGGGRR